MSDPVSDPVPDRVSGPVLAAIDGGAEDVVDLCLRLGNATDYPGEEVEVAEVVVAWLRTAGIDAFLQRIGPTSANAVGVVRGTGDRAGGGRSLILNAHMDTEGTVPTGGQDVEQRTRGAWRSDGAVLGRGIANDKAQLAAEMIALRAIHGSSLRLKESLFVTGVAQETSAPHRDGAEVEAWSGHGPRLSQVREGHGSRWLVEHGVVADYALVGEVTGHRVCVGQTGYLRLRIAVPGHVRYTPHVTRGDDLASNPNPFERAGHVLVALADWAREYERTDATEVGPTRFVPRAQVVEVTSPTPPYTEPTDHCHVFLDVRLVPGAAPADIVNRVRRVVDRLGLGCEVAPYDHRRGYVAEGAEPLVEALGRAHRAVLGEDVAHADTSQSSVWRDSNVFNEVGIPSVCYGTRTGGGRGGGLAGEDRPVAVADIVALAKVYALTALAVCGVEG